MPSGGAPAVMGTASPLGPSPTSTRAPLAGRIRDENARPGTDEWAQTGTADTEYDPKRLSAFPGAPSVNAGDPLDIYASSTGGAVAARLYRLGYYQNHGARLITTYSSIATPPQPACTRD